MNTILNNTEANTVVTNNNTDLMENKKAVVATQNADKKIKNATAVVANDGVDIEKELLEPIRTIANSGEYAVFNFIFQEQTVCVKRALIAQANNTRYPFPGIFA